MNQLWLRFESLLAIKAPHLLQRLNSGATQMDIDKLEEKIGKKLPNDFVAFYKVHNGQTTKNGREFLIDCEELLSIGRIINVWQKWKSVTEEDQIFAELTSEPDEGIKNNWWNRSWIPFTADGCGDNICIDLDPTHSGTFGQVIRMRHDMIYRDLLANSFSEYISNYIDGFESGKYVCVDEWGIVENGSAFTDNKKI